MPKDSDSEKDPKKAMAEALRQALKNKASQPHNDFAGKGGGTEKGGKGAKSAAPKARNFRHQGR